LLGFEALNFVATRQREPARTRISRGRAIVALLNQGSKESRSERVRVPGGQDMLQPVAKLGFGLLLGLLVGSLGEAAAAQPSPAAARSASQGVQSLSGTGPDYEVQFLDDALHALDGRDNIAQIRVRPGPSRTMLLRARTSFVSEMLESIELL
jgi:hypothetical protein